MFDFFLLAMGFQESINNKTNQKTFDERPDSP